MGFWLTLKTGRGSMRYIGRSFRHHGRNSGRLAVGPAETQNRSQMFRTSLGILMNSVITGNDVCSLIPYSHDDMSPRDEQLPGSGWGFDTFPNTT